VITHHGAELQFRAGSVGRPIAEGQRAAAIEKRDEHVIAHDPVVIVPQMREERARLRGRGLRFEQFVGGLPLHIGLHGQDEHFHGAFTRFRSRALERTQQNTTSSADQCGPGSEHGLAFQ
jgi:hypothetical protein